MNKKINKWIIIATVIILLGSIIFTVSMTMIDWNFKRLDTEEYKENGYLISDDFSNISINTDTADITFVPSNDNKCMIVCYETEYKKHNAVVEENTLNINLIDNRKWYEKIGVSFDNPKLTVHLPKSEYASLLIEESTGDIEISNYFKFENLNIKVSTGKIKLSSIESNEINLKVSTGDITLSDIYSTKLISNGTTGKISLDNVIVLEKIDVKRDTGDINLKNCDANELSLKTSTGDIKGNLLSEKQFITKTSTGDVNVPNSNSGGLCEIKTSTGDIEITVNQ